MAFGGEISQNGRRRRRRRRRRRPRRKCGRARAAESRRAAAQNLVAEPELLVCANVHVWVRIAGRGCVLLATIPQIFSGLAGSVPSLSIYIDFRYSTKSKRYARYITNTFPIYFLLLSRNHSASFAVACTR